MSGTTTEGRVWEASNGKRLRQVTKDVDVYLFHINKETKSILLGFGVSSTNFEVLGTELQREGTT